MHSECRSLYVHRLATEPHPVARIAMSPAMVTKRIRHMRRGVTLHRLWHMIVVCLHREQPTLFMLMS